MTSLDLSSIETPSVLIDHARLIGNIAWGQRTADTHHVKLRPHIKTHKSLHIARLQIEAGAVGITASKAEEALVFLNGGIKSVTVAYPQVAPVKVARLLAAALKNEAEVRFIADSPQGVQVLDNTAARHGGRVGVFLKIDVGLHRCGLQETDARLLPLVESIQKSRSLRFVGLLSHAGHAYGATDASQVRVIAEAECAVLNRVRCRLEAAGHAVVEVSVGATPTFLTSQSYEGITEVRPGNYVFLDQTVLRMGLAGPERVALSVLVSVVSANEDYLIIDAGSKALSSDLGAHGTGTPGGYGKAYPLSDYERHANGMPIVKLSEEHGFVRHEGRSLSVGARLRIIPNHACPVVNLAEGLVILKETELAAWPVDARGKVR
jgi:D-serine deaminase-like pyridoxal phosphate-dependent protein